MPSPVYSKGTIGNLIGGTTGQSVAHGSTFAVFLDLSACIEGQVVCEVDTGATAPTTGTTFSAYKVYAAGSSPNTTIASAVSAGATSLPVVSTTGMHQNQKIFLQQTSAQVGEIVIITGSVSGSPITISATINSYSSGDSVYLISQTATTTTTPGGASSTFSATTDYSSAIFLGTGQWAIAASNGDSTYAITVTATVDKITGYQ